MKLAPGSVWNVAASVGSLTQSCAQATRRAVTDDLSAFVKVIAGLLPQQFEVKDATFGHLDNDDLLALIDEVQRMIEQRRAVTIDAQPQPTLIEGSGLEWIPSRNGYRNRALGRPGTARRESFKKKPHRKGGARD